MKYGPYLHATPWKSSKALKQPKNSSPPPLQMEEEACETHSIQASGPSKFLDTLPDPRSCVVLTPLSPIDSANAPRGKARMDSNATNSEEMLSAIVVQTTPQNPNSSHPTSIQMNPILDPSIDFVNRLSLKRNRFEDPEVRRHSKVRRQEDGSLMILPHSGSVSHREHERNTSPHADTSIDPENGLCLHFPTNTEQHCFSNQRTYRRFTTRKTVRGVVECPTKDLQELKFEVSEEISMAEEAGLTMPPTQL
ncbi:unnamed protein product [Ilex paraguariensis]|uniref:Uncharacterized protein n=1 Tax=Ilex paraguariensis TaxID=185542 RepID=A0ABC8TWQ8_9AQUA